MDDAQVFLNIREGVTVIRMHGLYELSDFVEIDELYFPLIVTRDDGISLEKVV
jgi:hypothetical protein